MLQPSQTYCSSCKLLARIERQPQGCLHQISHKITALISNSCWRKPGLFFLVLRNLQKNLTLILMMGFCPWRNSPLTTPWPAKASSLVCVCVCVGLWVYTCACLDGGHRTTLGVRNTINLIWVKVLNGLELTSSAGWPVLLRNLTSHVHTVLGKGPEFSFSPTLDALHYL